MGNAIKHLKLSITRVDPGTLEQEAKDKLLGVIEQYVNEKIILADKAIAGSCLGIIRDGDVILIHAQYVHTYVCVFRSYPWQSQSLDNANS